MTVWQVKMKMIFLRLPVLVQCLSPDSFLKTHRLNEMMILKIRQQSHSLDTTSEFIVFSFIFVTMHIASFH